MVKKPAYMYEFPTEEAANQFYSLAMYHQKSKIVQHPQQNGVQDKLRVLVTGSGSNVYDMLLVRICPNKLRSLEEDLYQKFKFSYYVKPESPLDSLVLILLVSLSFLVLLAFLSLWYDHIQGILV